MSKKQVSVVLSVRGKEPLLDGTIRNLRTKAGMPIDIVLINDGGDYEHLTECDIDQLLVNSKNRGCAYSRHRGIMESTTPIIMVCDAHMNFSDKWAVALCEWFNDNKGSFVTCAEMGACDYDLEPLDVTPHTGANFTWKSIEPIGGTTTTENLAFHAKWANNKAGPISCVMGAFYAFKRNYYGTMGEPWKVGTSWGSDEEYISMASHLCGDGVMLMPNHIRGYHHFRKTIPWNPTQSDLFYTWVNRFRLVHVAPMHTEEKQMLWNWMGENPMIQLYDSSFKNTLAADFNRPDVAELKRLFESKRAKWEPFFKNYVTVLENVNCVEETTKLYEAHRSAHTKMVTTINPTITNDVVEPVKAAPQMFVRKVEVCDLCDRVDQWVVYKTIEAHGNIPKRQYLKCKCGNRGVRINLGPIDQSRAAKQDMV